MDITHQLADSNILVITPSNNCLDASEVEEFQLKVLSILNTEHPNGVVLNLEKLQFIDSSGLGSLLTVLRHLNAQGNDLKLSHVNQPVRAIVELVRMHKIIEIYPTAKDAIHAFKIENP